MRDVAVVSFAQAPSVRSDTRRIAAISAKEKPAKNFRSTTSASSGSTAASSSRAALTRASSSRPGRASWASSSEAISTWPPRFSARRLRT